MASLPHHLPSLLLLGFLYTSIAGDSVQSPIAACPSFNCGNGIPISYPFWHINQQFEHCGYPDLNVSCSDQNPVLNLSNHLYQVRNIDYSSKSLSLFYTDLKEVNCPKVPHGFTLNTTLSLFNYTFGNKMLHFFYNCSLYPPSLRHMACLGYGAKRSYVFMEGAIPEFDWNRYCDESNVLVLVTDEAIGDGGDLVQSFGQALQHGFKLSWQQRDAACQSCEATGGLCGYSNSDQQKNFFFCNCPDGSNHSIICYDQKGAAPSSVRLEPDYVAIGLLVFGGLAMAATVFYFIKKKKMGSYKPV